MTRLHTIVDSPVGELTIVAGDDGLTGLYFSEHLRMPAAETFGGRVDVTHIGAAKPHGPAEPGTARHLAAAASELAEYFAGERTHFEVALAPEGNDFQKRVWGLLADIPFGETSSYGRLAIELGDRNLAQAVGSANGRNPISIIVPCHRVIGADGSLTGYAGGLERKSFLLELEEGETARAQRLF